MKFTRYSKYVADPAGEMSMEELLNALSDYLLQSGFQNPYDFYQLPDQEQTMERRDRVGERDADDELSTVRECGRTHAERRAPALA